MSITGKQLYLTHSAAVVGKDDTVPWENQSDGNQRFWCKLAEVVQQLGATADTRYKQAAEALWKLLDDIDTTDDAARDDDTCYRVNARTIAKRRSEYAQSFDGQTLLWSWECPLQAEEIAALESKVLYGKASDDEEAQFKQVKDAIDAAELPPEFYDITSAALAKGLTSE